MKFIKIVLMLTLQFNLMLDVLSETELNAIDKGLR